MAVVDSRYARAFAAVVEDQKLNVVAEQGKLSDFADTLEGSVELREVLENPSIPEPQKLKVLDAIAGRIGMSKTARNLIAVMMSHQRLHELRGVLGSYEGIADAASSVTETEITTARPLDAANKKLLEEQVSKLAGGQQVRATYSEDPSLLGGAVVRIGSTVYDGSVRAQLQQLKQRMVAASI
jgi:F-type H+-transporting ATPase subunit delta